MLVNHDIHGLSLMSVTLLQKSQLISTSSPIPDHNIQALQITFLDSPVLVDVYPKPTTLD